eukprot:TRINITY_DN26345_c0_g1_i1.p1 TRINITY_DN26345_c0_g1~~TRINITY_DN26345_c0_g1_i1.p1  ORF type:complete len:263 (-),score=3.10 TRINITY_DN26345_c0_g1_i1:149-904(-)
MGITEFKNKKADFSKQYYQISVSGSELKEIFNSKEVQNQSLNILSSPSKIITNIHKSTNMKNLKISSTDNRQAVKFVILNNKARVVFEDCTFSVVGLHITSATLSTSYAANQILIKNVECLKSSGDGIFVKLQGTHYCSIDAACINNSQQTGIAIDNQVRKCDIKNVIFLILENTVLCVRMETFRIVQQKIQGVTEFLQQVQLNTTILHLKEMLQETLLTQSMLQQLLQQLRHLYCCFILHCYSYEKKFNQ